VFEFLKDTWYGLLQIMSQEVTSDCYPKGDVMADVSDESNTTSNNNTDVVAEHKLASHSAVTDDKGVTDDHAASAVVSPASVAGASIEAAESRPSHAAVTSDTPASSDALASTGYEAVESTPHHGAITSNIPASTGYLLTLSDLVESLL